MDTTNTVLEVAAAVDTDGVDRNTWTATGLDITVGFNAVGDSFHDARRHFAEVVALAVSAGVIDTGDHKPTAIRVISHTRKTFPLDQLQGASQ